MMMSPQVADATHRGSTDLRGGNKHPSFAAYGTFTCLEDEIMVGAFTAQQNSKLFQALKLGDLMEIPETLTLSWLKQHADKLRDHMSPIFAKRTASEWEILLNEHDIPAARVRDMYDMLSNEQQERAASSQFQRVAEREITAPIAAFNYAEDGPDLTVRCAKHGEDTDEVLSELGFSDQQLTELRKNGAIH